MIDQTTIQKIFDAAIITEVVGGFVSLKKRGVNYIGLCPFHNEKTPSFTVSPAKGIYKCFGCGKGGNSVNFIMDHENISYPDALRTLAAKYNIPILEKEQTAEEIQHKNERESMLIVNTFASQYFSEILQNDPKGKAIGLSYFQHRGFTEKIIKTFDLGYCPEGRDTFTKAAMAQAYKADYLIKTGLTIEREGRYFDRFWGRVMFPIHSLSGKVIAFGGRTLRSDKKAAKYLNSPESEVYHKSNILYGIYHAKRSIVQLDKCYMVEGYTDVISLYQAGIENVVASSGTSLTVNQIKLVKRFSKNLTILYDGDAAGIKASLRGIDLVLQEGMNVKVLLLPEGEDPDSFSKSMVSDALKEYIDKNETDFITFKTKLLLDDTKNDPIKKAGLISDIVKSIAVIPDKIVRAVYVKACSELLEIKEAILYEEISRINYKADEKTYYQQKTTPPTKNTSATSTENDDPPIFIPDDISGGEGEVLESKTKSESAVSKHGKVYETENVLTIFEHEIIRVLINYGTLVLEIYEDEDDNEQPTVAEYIVVEICGQDRDFLKFSHPLYRQIVRDFEINMENGAIPDDKYFIQHNNSEISSLIAGLVAEKYQLSNIWKKDDNYVKVDEINIDSAVPKLVLGFKDQKIKHMTEEISEQLKNLKDKSKTFEIMRQIKELKRLSMEIAKKLGERTIIP